MSAEEFNIAEKYLIKEGVYDQTIKSMSGNEDCDLSDLLMHFLEQSQTERERKLYEALENLVEYQNGAPLARYEKEYNEAYDNAIKTLNECKTNDLNDERE